MMKKKCQNVNIFETLCVRAHARRAPEGAPHCNALAGASSGLFEWAFIGGRLQNDSV
jgi:hypothetical protein